MDSFERKAFLSSVGVAKVEQAGEILISLTKDGDACRKLLIFAHHRVVISALCELFTKNHIPYACMVGGVSQAERKTNLEQFNTNPEMLVAIVGLTVGSEGLSFTGCQTVVFMEIPNTISVEEQAIARVHRIGQEAASVHVYYFMALHDIDQGRWRALNQQTGEWKAALNGDDQDTTRVMDVCSAKPQLGAIILSPTLPMVSQEYVSEHEDIPWTQMSAVSDLCMSQLTASFLEPMTDLDIGFSVSPFTGTVHFLERDQGTWRAMGVTFKFDQVELLFQTLMMSSWSDVKEQKIRHLSDVERWQLCFQVNRRLYGLLMVLNRGNKLMRLTAWFVKLWQAMPESSRKKSINTQATLVSIPLQLKFVSETNSVEIRPAVEIEARQLELSWLKKGHNSRLRYMGWNDFNWAREYEGKNYSRGSDCNKNATAMSVPVKRNGREFFIRRYRESPMGEMNTAFDLDGLGKAGGTSTERKNVRYQYQMFTTTAGGYACMVCIHPFCKELYEPVHTDLLEVRQSFYDFFCNPKCYQDYAVRTGNSNAIKKLCLQRDKAVCCICSVNLGALMSKLKAVSGGSAARETILEQCRAFNDRISRLHRVNIVEADILLTGMFWELDHVKAVYQGGGQCDLGNLRTLCIPCHSMVTKKQARDRKTQRAAKKIRKRKKSMKAHGLGLQRPRSQLLSVRKKPRLQIVEHTPVKHSATLNILDK
jgi:hypothetical protein